MFKVISCILFILGVLVIGNIMCYLYLCLYAPLFLILFLMKKERKFGLLLEFQFIDFFLFWQSLVNVLESSAGNTPCYSLILFQDLLVSTTLSPVWLNFQVQFWFFIA